MVGGKPQRTAYKNVSQTALLIAKAQVFIYHDSKRTELVSDDAARISLSLVEAYSGSKVFEKYLVSNFFYRFFIGTMERVVYPEVILHYAVRKKVIERQTRIFLAKNPSGQAVMLAGGLDSLFTRLHKEYPDALFLELDQESTQVLKKDVVQKNFSPSKNLIFYPADFSKENIDSVLGDVRAFQSEKPTLFIAEGLTMYLEERAVRNIFKSIRRTGKSSSRFILFTFMEAPKMKNLTSGISNGLSDVWLKSKGEQYKWSFERERIKTFLDSEVFAVLSTESCHDLKKPYLSPSGYKKVLSTRDENICLCESLS